MPKPYSHDLRERVVRAVEAGASCHEAAATFEVGVSSAIRWVARWRQTGSVAAKPTGGKRSPLDAHKDWLLALIAAEPDLTLQEIRGRLRTLGALDLPRFRGQVRSWDQGVRLTALCPPL
jgi:transposase